MSKYNLLLDVYNSHQCGLLDIPGLLPFYAFFSKLYMTGKSGEISINYKFEFISSNETYPNYNSTDEVNNIYTPQKGESLFSIANKFNIPFDDIFKKNPNIYSPFYLDSDQKVIL